MSREVRKVPATWEHPKDENGNYIPFYSSFPFNEEEIQEGLREGWLEDNPPHYGCNVMPDWPEVERTHYQMYETTSEGTPISPVFENPEALAHWLADNKASASGRMTATYEQWLAMIVGSGYAPSAVIINGKIMSGVEALNKAN